MSSHLPERERREERRRGRDGKKDEDKTRGKMNFSLEGKDAVVKTRIQQR